MSEIHKRVLTGILASLGLIIVLEFVPFRILTVFTCLYLGAYEYFVIIHLGHSKHLNQDILEDFNGPTLVIYFIPLAFLWAAISPYREGIVCMSLILAIIFSIVVRLYQYSKHCAREKPEDPIKKYAFTVLSVILADVLFLIFVDFPFSFTLLLSVCNQDKIYLFLWFLATFQADNGALLFGKLFGSYHPFPYISPQKTIQGIVGAYVLCFLSLLALIPFGGYWIIPKLKLIDTFILAIVCSSLAIIGDLTESFIKRVGGVKDSGSMFPGHGGMLDRLDSLVWVTPFVYYYSYYILSAYNPIT